MLVYQAIRASELFLDKTYSKDVADSIFKDIYTQKLNIVLIGMPGVGKTTIGKQLAKEFNKTFVDMDELIVNKENKMDILDIEIEKITDQYIGYLDKMEEMHLNQTQLAERMECSQQYVSKVLRGQENLSIETIVKIEQALNIQIFC